MINACNSYLKKFDNTHNVMFMRSGSDSLNGVKPKNSTNKKKDEDDRTKRFESCNGNSDS